VGGSSGISPSDAVVAAARTYARESYLAALLAPSKVRGDLIVLAAFEGEIARIPLVVSEPMMGEIRLQWWRDWIEMMGPGLSSGNPVADALGDVVRRRGIDVGGLLASLDARSRDLGSETIADNHELLLYVDAVEGAALARSAAVTKAAVTGESGAPAATEKSLIVVASGRALGLLRVLLSLPEQVRTGRLLVPGADATHLEAAASQLAAEIGRCGRLGRRLAARCGRLYSRLPSLSLICKVCKGLDWLRHVLTVA